MKLKQTLPSAVFLVLLFLLMCVAPVTVLAKAKAKRTSVPVDTGACDAILKSATESYQELLPSKELQDFISTCHETSTVTSLQDALTRLRISREKLFRTVQLERNLPSTLPEDEQDYRKCQKTFQAHQRLEPEIVMKQLSAANRKAIECYLISTDLFQLYSELQRLDE